jgi:hypothetical protein
MWDPITSGVHTTRDIIWLRRMFYTKNIGFDIVVEPKVLEDMPPTQQVSPAPAEAPVVLEDLPTLMPGRDDVDDVSEGDETVPAGNSEDPGHNDAPVARTSSGRAVRAPLRLISEIGTMATQGHMAAYEYEMVLSQPEYNFYSVMTQLDEDVRELAYMSMVKGVEYALIGAALASGFDNTTELHVMNYREAMASAEKDKWVAAMDEEHHGTPQGLESYSTV